MFSPSQWADPTFLTFVKEYWEFNFKEKYKFVTVTVVFYIALDNSEVLQDILLFLEVAGGRVVPRLLLGKKMSKMNNAIFFAGNPAAWRAVAQTGSVEQLQGRAVIPDDNFKMVKGEVAKTFFAIGNRVADRLAQGARPSINVKESVRYDEPNPAGIQGLVAPAATPTRAPQSQKSAFEKLDEMADAKFVIGGMEVGSRKLVIKLTYEQELKTLREFGPKKLDKYWKKVEEKPLKEKYIAVTDPLKLPVQLFAVPNLRSDLLAFRKKGVDENEEFNVVEQYLNEKLAAAQAALGSEPPASSEPASIAPAPTEPRTFIEFPVNTSGAAMICHIDFKQPVLINSKDQLAVVKGVLENLDLVQNIQIMLSGMVALSQQKMRAKALNEELDLLKKQGFKHLDKYWEHVETLASKETFEPGKTSFGLLLQLVATPTLRTDLLALRGKIADAKEEYAMVEDFLNTQLRG